MPLTDPQRAVLELERSWWAAEASGPKDALIAERLGIGADEYYAMLQGLLDDPEALEEFPLVVRRLRRMRDRRRRDRTASTTAGASR